MKPWAAGNRDGMGEVFLPNAKTRDAYYTACVDAQINADATAICSMRSVDLRRARIAMYPEIRRERLKDRVAELWVKP